MKNIGYIHRTLYDAIRYNLYYKDGKYFMKNQDQDNSFKELMISPDIDPDTDLENKYLIITLSKQTPKQINDLGFIMNPTVEIINHAASRDGS